MQLVTTASRDQQLIPKTHMIVVPISSLLPKVCNLFWNGQNSDSRRIQTFYNNKYCFYLNVKYLDTQLIILIKKYEIILIGGVF